MEKHSDLHQRELFGRKKNKICRHTTLVHLKKIQYNLETIDLYFKPIQQNIQTGLNENIQVSLPVVSRELAIFVSTFLGTICTTGFKYSGVLFTATSLTPDHESMVR